jgi:hypothetical protein
MPSGCVKETGGKREGKRALRREGSLALSFPCSLHVIGKEAPYICPPKGKTKSPTDF